MNNEEKKVRQTWKGIDALNSKIQQLEKENAELKCTIAGLEKLLSNAVNQKFLNRQEVGKILNHYLYTEEFIICGETEATTAICNLALKIDRDKIVEVLNKCSKLVDKYNYFEVIDTIADEIIKEIANG